MSQRNLIAICKRPPHSPSMPETFALTPLLLACALTFLAGAVKGAIGFAMPLIMVSTLTLFLEPRLVVAGLILPILLTNGVQTFRRGLAPAMAAAKEFRVYLVLTCAMILLSSQFLTRIPEAAMFLILGVPVVVLCSVQLLGLRPVIPQRWRGPFGWLAGIISGTIGGLAGTWGPPTVLYLTALETPKAKQVTVQGVIYGLGSVMLLLGHLRSGVLNAQTAPFSALLILPALAGMMVGFRIHDRIDQETFRRATLMVLLIAGLNLIRKGLLG